MSLLQRRSFALTLVVAAVSAVCLATSAQALETSTPILSGKVFTSTNSPTGNELLVYGRAADGSLQLLGREPTQGLGTGGGLGSQGAVTLSGDGRHVYVVNAGSHTVSTFALAGQRLSLVSVTPSGGLQPVSVAEAEGTVYVLNAGGSGNVAGFRDAGGTLQPLADGVRSLSGNAVGPAQVGIGRDVLVVTEKATNRLVTWRLSADGTAGQRAVTPASGITPFGFAIDQRDHLVVSEAFGGAPFGSAASSYSFSPRGGATPLAVSASVPTQQTAACWVAMTPNGRWAFTGNAGNSSISSYGVASDGRLTLQQPAAGITGPNAGVTDLAVSRDGHALYALAPRGAQIASYAIQRDGTLQQLGSAGGLPGTPAGLAAN
jgi:6-phosphogluconolactonase (cycloisomerase 2 family)